MLLGHLDYFRTIEAQKISTTSALDIELMYVGKMDPATDMFPTLPKEPADSHITPSKRPSRLRRLAEEEALAEGQNVYELPRGMDGQKILLIEAPEEAEFEEVVEST